MFDTVAISQTFARSPDVVLLSEKGCQVFYSKYTGEPFRMALNAEKNAKEPRITIDKSPKALWILKAEVSIGAWLFGSNLHLPDENDLNCFFSMLSEYVGDKTGIKFDARIERVTRADVTRDFQVGESRVLPILAAVGKMMLAKYNRQIFNDTGVYFENKGEKKNKKYCFYSKYDELLSKKAGLNELAAAKGLIRFEIQHKNTRAVVNLAKSQKLKSHTADQVFTRRVSESVIENTMKLFNFMSLLEGSNSELEKLFDACDPFNALRLAGHLAAKAQFGANYGNLPFINIPPKTVKGYDRQCAKAGVLSLE